MPAVINWRRVAEGPLQEDPDELEALLVTHPDRLHVRVQLVGHYLTHPITPSAQVRRHAHIHWLIAHHPEVGLEGFAYINADLFPKAYDEGKQHWLWVITERPNDPVILRNASQFLFLHDRVLAEKLVRQGASLEPTVFGWRECIGLLRCFDWYDAVSDGERVRIAREAMVEYEKALTLALSPPEAHRLLIEFMRFASKAGDHQHAAEAAKHILAHTKDFQATFQGGRGMHYAHVALGNSALAEGDLRAARGHLSAATSTDAWFCAGEIFGPDFSLAEALLKHGERDIVIDYLVACQSCWPHAELLERWKKAVEEGQIPSFQMRY